jgi:hypothetical protein
MKTNPNEPINPTIWDDRNKPEIIRDNDGLTKREYFAAMTMQGYLASVSSDVIEKPEYAAFHAVKYADALINELNKNDENTKAKL